ncbi:hypothetical protein ACN38_g5197 [Penicillium nordicum]|uniref:Uncharacterized protein n=1 Tax=Penicillium nordicum TaxID=229535 RepID=A0A0M8P988_9EURO|nr:hypothetical protein ACN38_g5197 [Penicillium nordicum]
MPVWGMILSSNLLNFVSDVKQNHIWTLCFAFAHIPHSHFIPTFQRVGDLTLSTTSGVGHLLQLSPVLSRALLATLIFHHASSLADRGLPRHSSSHRWRTLCSG